jgi:hypothetical protein
VNPALGLLVLACLAAVFTLGVIAGRMIVASRHSDRILSHELRPIDPQRAAAIRARFMPPVYAAAGSEPPIRGDTAEDAMRGAEALSASIRFPVEDHALADPTPDETAVANGKCGLPVDVMLGQRRVTVPCLRAPEHHGGCQ